MTELSDDVHEERLKRGTWVDAVLGMVFGLIFVVAMFGFFGGAIYAFVYFGDFDLPLVDIPARLEFTKIVMHRPGEYTVFSLQGDCYVERTFHGTLVKDVQPGEPMYVEYTKQIRQTARTGKTVESDGAVWHTPVRIHIHDIDELGGAGWHQNKQSGQTTVIE